MTETPLRRQYHPPSKRTKLALIAERRLRRKQEQWSSRFKLLILAAFLATVFMCSFAFLRLIFKDYPGDAARLQAVLPLVEKYKLNAFFNTDWCKSISYERGLFFESGKDSAGRCSQFSGGRIAVPFDNQSRVDFDLIARSLNANGSDGVEYGIFDNSGRVKYVAFHKDCVFCRTRYVYSPNYGKLPREISGDVWHTKINTDWYLTDEDWN